MSASRGPVFLGSLVLLALCVVLPANADEAPLFVDATAAAGFRHVHVKPSLDARLEPIMPWMSALGAAACVADYNRDGKLDLFATNSRQGEPNFLYRNNGDGTFTEVGATAGVARWNDAGGVAMDCVWGDVDNDGWPDLFVARWGRSLLLHNRGDGSFEDVTAQRFRRVDGSPGTDWKNTNAAIFFDLDNDGRLDVFVTNITSTRYLREGNMLWHNQGPGEDGIPRFVDVAAETGTFDAGWGWGAKFFDADADGDLDLVAADGFVTAGEGDYWLRLGKWRSGPHDPLDALAWPPLENMSFSGSEPLRFFRNDADGATFSERAREVGLVSQRDNRGVVVFDADDDGDLDVYVANQGQPADFFRNQGVPGNHWLIVELVGDPTAGTTRDAVGALVSAQTSERRMLRLRDGGSSFCGQSDPRLYFGLGHAERVEKLEIRWPGGGVETLEGVKADQILTIRQAVGAR
ncbi:MAG: CRTAC1 family protein [Thermoanaerobaculia bacterium]|nr:CRTAC1 family protein [Thermoanaerobaculia bacterium]